MESILTEREKEIYGARMSGTTFARIGKEQGISTTRAAQIFRQARRKRRRQKYSKMSPELKALLTDAWKGNEYSDLYFAIGYLFLTTT